MGSLSEHDLKNVLAISRTALECNSFDEMQAEMLRSVGEFLHAPKSCFFRVTSDGREPKIHRGSGCGVDDKDLAEYNQRYKRFDPLALRLDRDWKPGRSCVVQTHQFVGSKGFFGSEFYNDFLNPQSIHFVLGMTLLARGKPIALLGLHRPRNARPFSQREITLAELLVPQLSAAQTKCLAYDQVEEREWIIDALTGDLNQQGVMILDRNFLPVFCCPRAAELLEISPALGKAGSVRHPVDLPEALYDSCRRVRDAVKWNRRLGQSGSFELQLASLRQPLQVSVSALECGDEGPRFMVTFKGEGTATVCAERMRALGLTRRETDIAQLVTVGLTNPEVADKLCISVRTVQNHLRSIYEKTGVHNRTSLAFRLNSNG